ncbi:hypothetical protein C8J57DRAFT_1460615 [Mycena rebaudengoi]|nr:hypothetical protein C8J57DRAFT_1460615 [Mycena rebaudengoi]
MSSPPTKRQRTEDRPITRSTIWHDDGGVVLQADDTQFRVHWGVLSLHSPFFQGMRGLPQPPDQETVEGCPLIELPDTAEDFEHLLNALYHPAVTNQKALSFAMIASFIRLGRKYEFKELLDIAMIRLTFEHPTSLQGYDATLVITDVADGRSPLYRATSIVHYGGILLDLVNLARENSLLSILPCAYYRVLVFHKLVDIFDSIRRQDGTSATLTPTDQRTLVLARQKIYEAQWKTGNTLGWAGSVLGHGQCDSHCRSRSILDTIARKGAIVALYPVEIFLSRFCVRCKSNAQESMALGRAKMWEDLPGFFGLPAWAELKDDL